MEEKKGERNAGGDCQYRRAFLDKDHGHGAL